MGSSCTSAKKNDKKYRNKSNTANTTHLSPKPINEIPSVFFDHVIKENYAIKDDENDNKAISQLVFKKYIPATSSEVKSIKSLNSTNITLSSKKIVNSTN